MWSKTDDNAVFSSPCAGFTPIVSCLYLERDHAKVTFWKSLALSSIKFVFLWSTIWALTKSFLKDLSIHYRKQHFLRLTVSKVIQG